MEKDYLLPNKIYDALKNVALVLLPGIGALYYALALIWGFPKAEEVLGSLAAVATFLGLFIKKSDQSYNNSDAKFDGQLYVGPDLNRFVYHQPLEVLEQKDSLSFKVHNTPPPEFEHGDDDLIA